MIFILIFPPNFPNYNKKFNTDIYIYLEGFQNQTCMMYKGNKFRKIKDNCLYLEDRLKDMNKMGIDKQVLSCVPIMFSYDAPVEEAKEIVAFINDFLSNSVLQYPEKIMALGTLPMQDIESCLQVIEENNNFIGYQIGSNINNINLDHEKFYPLYKKYVIRI